ncbi:MAG: hypothetical protein U9P50_02030 [Patescibacteria group bacterium]|nr:hypothetical protein [Patescibacteria group bacterium]
MSMRETCDYAKEIIMGRLKELDEGTLLEWCEFDSFRNDIGIWAKELVQVGAV